MRVLLYWALGGVGGVQRIYAFLTKALCELGLNTTVLMPSGLGLDFIRRFHGVDLSSCRGLVVTKYGSLNCGNIYCGLINSLVGNTVLSDMAKDYDLVFLDTPFLWPFDWRRAKNVVFYLHDPLTTPRPRPILTVRLHRFFYFGVTSMGLSYDVVLRNPSNVYANSLFTAYLTERFIGIRPKVLYPPIDFDLIRRYAKTNKEPVVAMLARFGLAKGQDFAIRAFSRAVKLCDLGDAELVLMGAAGDASSYAYVRRLAKLSKGLGIGGRVRLVVNPSVDEVYEVLGRSSVFIHVKPHESFGIVVAEAMAAGAVPVVHRSGGPWIDLVRMGRFGFGFTNEEEAALGICKALEAGDSVRSGIVEWARRFSYESFRDGVGRIVGSFVA